jgi:hypothetical protein
MQCLSTLRSGCFALATGEHSVARRGSVLSATTNDRPSAGVRRRLEISQAIYAAAKFSIADHLAAGPRGIADLAAATSTHPESLYRLLRALASVGPTS